MREDSVGDAHRLGIIMHGVTGRMGLNQHLVRSILRDPRAGRRRAAERRPRDARPDPGRPQRREDRGARARVRHRALRPPISTRRWRIPNDTVFFDAATTQMRADLLTPRDRGRQARLLREADRRHARARRSRWRKLAEPARREERRRAGQAVPAGPAQDADAARCPASSAASSRCAASSATGCSRATGASRRSARAGTTARTKAAASSSICCATGATCSTTCSATVKAVSCLGATHIPERVDESGKTYEADADDAAYATFELEGGVDRPDQFVLVRARAPRRSRHLPGRRHARLGGRRPDALLHPAPRQHAAPGLESGRAADHELLRQWEEVPDNIVYDNGFKLQWEDFIRHVVADTPWKHDLMEGAKGVQLAELGLEELGRAALARRAGSWRSESRWRRSRCRPAPQAASPTRPASRSCCPTQGATPRLQPRRLRGRACRRRSAGRQRSLARRRDRLGQDDRVPPITSGTSGSASPKRWTRRSAAWGSTGRAPRELIRRALEAAKARPGVQIACGAGTDHLAPSPGVTVDDVIRAYEEQIEAIEAMGGRLILMASRALANAAQGPDDYARVYGRILRQVKRAGDHPLARRDVRSGARRLLGLGRPLARDGDLPRDHSPTTPPRSTASRSRSCRRRRRSPCAAACRTACACIPATTSTMPS